MTKVMTVVAPGTQQVKQPPAYRVIDNQYPDKNDKWWLKSGEKLEKEMNDLAEAGYELYDIDNNGKFIFTYVGTEDEE